MMTCLLSARSHQAPWQGLLDPRSAGEVTRHDCMGKWEWSIWELVQMAPGFVQLKYTKTVRTSWSDFGVGQLLLPSISGLCASNRPKCMKIWRALSHYERSNGAHESKHASQQEKAELELTWLFLFCLVFKAPVSASTNMFSQCAQLWASWTPQAIHSLDISFGLFDNFSKLCCARVFKISGRI